MACIMRPRDGLVIIHETCLEMARDWRRYSEPSLITDSQSPVPTFSAAARAAVERLIKKLLTPSSRLVKSSPEKVTWTSFSPATIAINP
jgi:hypothetical protein